MTLIAFLLHLLQSLLHLGSACVKDSHLIGLLQTDHKAKPTQHCVEQKQPWRSCEGVVTFSIRREQLCRAVYISSGWAVAICNDSLRLSCIEHTVWASICEVRYNTVALMEHIAEII